MGKIEFFGITEAGIEAPCWNPVSSICAQCPVLLWETARLHPWGRSLKGGLSLWKWRQVSFWNRVVCPSYAKSFLVAIMPGRPVQGPWGSPNFWGQSAHGAPGSPKRQDGFPAGAFPSELPRTGHRQRCQGKWSHSVSKWWWRTHMSPVRAPRQGQGSAGALSWRED